MHPTLEKWHQYVESKDSQILGDILAENVTFHSPVVHTPQEGRVMTAIYLTAATGLLSENEGAQGFQYVNKVVDDRHFYLEFTCTIDGVHINGIDMIEVDEHGKIIHFKVMIRPLKAINIVHQKMGEMLSNWKS